MRDAHLGLSFVISTPTTLSTEAGALKFTSAARAIASTITTAAVATKASLKSNAVITVGDCGPNTRFGSIAISRFIEM